KVCVHPAIGSTGIRNGYATVIHVRHGGTTRFVRPQAVAALPIPVEVYPRSNNQGHQVPFLRTFIVRGGSVNEVVLHGCWPDRGARESGIHRPCRQPWL